MDQNNDKMQLTFAQDISRLPQMLAFNYDELSLSLTNYLEKFKGLIVTEDGIKAAEFDRASINKTRDVIKRVRIDIKKQAFDDFELKAKTLEGMCDRASDAITLQLREFESRRVDLKRKTVETLMSNTLDRTLGFECPMRSSKHWASMAAECFCRAKGAWSNVGTTDKSIVDEIEAKVEKAKRDEATLEAFIENDTLDVQTVARDRFYEAFDLTAALEYVKNFKAERARIEAARAAEDARRAERARIEEEKARAEKERKAGEKTEAKDLLEEARPTIGKHIAERVAETAKRVEAKPEPVYTFRLEITGTKEALRRMKEFGLGMGIAFKNIDKEAK